MVFARISDDRTADAAYRNVFSIVTKGSRPIKAVVGYHSGNVHCRVAWNRKLGIWVMHPPRGWDSHLLIFGTQNPELHRSRSLNITVQINVFESAVGRQR